MSIRCIPAVWAGSDSLFFVSRLFRPTRPTDIICCHSAHLLSVPLGARFVFVFHSDTRSIQLSFESGRPIIGTQHSTTEARLIRTLERTNLIPHIELVPLYGAALQGVENGGGMFLWCSQRNRRIGASKSFVTELCLCTCDCLRSCPKNSCSNSSGVFVVCRQRWPQHDMHACVCSSVCVWYVLCCGWESVWCVSWIRACVQWKVTSTLVCRASVVCPVVCPVVCRRTKLVTLSRQINNMGIFTRLPPPLPPLLVCWFNVNTGTCVKYTNAWPA